MANLKKYDISNNKSVKNWYEAVPLGNGKIGTLVYGDGAPLKLSVDRVDLWDERPHPNTLEKGFNFKNLVKLSKSGKQEDWEERNRLFEIIYSDTAYPTKLTAGRLELDFGAKTKNVETYLSIEKAVANVLIDGGKIGKVELFLSATRFVGVAKVWGDYQLQLHVPLYLSGDENGEWGNYSGIGKTENDGCMRYPQAKKSANEGYYYYEQPTLDDFSFGIVALKRDFGEYSEIYYTVATSKDDINYIESAKTELAKVAEIGYEKLKVEHIVWWKRYWSKSEISIGEQLLEKTYYRSYYLFASCSRKGYYPMPLQGVWTADNDSVPPWKGDYHHDTNTQLSYQSFLKANRMEEGSCFIDYIWNLREVFQNFTKSFYGVKGLIIPAMSTLNGKPLGGWAQYSLSPTMTIWTAQSFDEYWLYTGDKKFLRTRAYPFFKDVGDAIYALLEEMDGKLYLPLSSSPEIYDDSRDAYLQPNSNFDLSLLIYLFKTLKNYSDILGKNSEKYVDTLSKLDSIAIDDEGVIMLDKIRRLPESHRHFSHVMCLYPLHLINYDSEDNKRIYENTLRHLDELGTGCWVGFAFPMYAQICAMMHNGGAAYEKLRMFAKGYVADNGFHLNGDFKHYGFSQWHYHPFTLESSFGFCDALQEMLLQEHNGYIELFPATPEEWSKKASFKKLRSYQGVLVSATMKDGITQKALLESKKTVTVKVFNNFGSDMLFVENIGEKRVVKVKQGECFELCLKKGRTKIKSMEQGEIINAGEW